MRCDPDAAGDVLHRRRLRIHTVGRGGGGYAIGHMLTAIVDDLRAHEWWIADVLFCGVLILLARRGRDVSILRFLRARITSAET